MSTTNEIKNAAEAQRQSMLIRKSVVNLRDALLCSLEKYNQNNSEDTVRMAVGEGGVGEHDRGLVQVPRPAGLARIGARILSLHEQRVTAAWDQLMSQAADAVPNLVGKPFPENVPERDGPVVLGAWKTNFGQYNDVVDFICTPGSMKWDKLVKIGEFDPATISGMGQEHHFLGIFCNPGELAGAGYKVYRTLHQSYLFLKECYQLASLEFEASKSLENFRNTVESNVATTRGLEVEDRQALEEMGADHPDVVHNIIGCDLQKIADIVVNQGEMRLSINRLFVCYNSKTNPHSEHTKAEYTKVEAMIMTSTTEIKAVELTLSRMHITLQARLTREAVSPPPPPTTAATPPPPPPPPLPTHSSDVARLTRLKVRNYDGSDVTQYISWRREFKELVLAFDKCQVTQLIRLKESLSGQALLLVRDIHDINLAMTSLDEHYGSSTRVLLAIRRQMKSFPLLVPSKPSNTVNFYNFWERVSYQLREHKCFDKMANEDNLTILGSKFCFSYQDMLFQSMNGAVTPSQKLNRITKFLKELRDSAVQKEELIDVISEQKEDVDRAIKKKAPKALITEVKGEALVGSAKKGIKPKSPKDKAMVATTTDKEDKKPFQCVAKGCTFTRPHYLGGCRKFSQMSPAEALDLIVRLKRCVFCLQYHPNNKCRKLEDKDNDWTCRKMENGNPCGLNHHFRLHEAKGIKDKSLVATAMIEQDELESYFMAQYVPYFDSNSNTKFCVTIFDTCATRCFAREEFCKSNNFDSVPVRLDVRGIGENTLRLDTAIYTVCLKLGDQSLTVHAVGIPSVSGPLEAINSCQLPNEIKRLVQYRPHGNIDLLLSIREHKYFPQKQKIVNDLIISRSYFVDQYKNDLVISGSSHRRFGSLHVDRVFIAALSNIEKQMFQVSELFGVEKFGTCQVCSKCKECDFRIKSLNAQELLETQRIEDKMNYDTTTMIWQVGIPWRYQDYVERIGNTYQMAVKRALSLENKVMRYNLVKQFCEVLEDQFSRGVYKPVSELPPTDWSVFVPMDFVHNETSTSTPCRNTLDGSAKIGGHQSLNDCLYKGANFLIPVLDATLHFRTRKIAVVADLKKAYNHLACLEHESATIRILWRGPEDWGEPIDLKPFKEFGLCRVSYGIKPSGCQLALSLRKTAKMKRNLEKYPLAAQSFLKRIVVDDLCDCFNTMEEAVDFMEQVKGLAAECGQEVKKFVVSGQGLEVEISGSRYLGIIWDAENDKIIFKGKVNLSAKRRGKRIDPDVETTLKDLVITKRIALRILMTLFDPMGLISPLLMEIKHRYRVLENCAWDQKLSPELCQSWKEVIDAIVDLEVSFPRSVFPEGSGEYEILGAGDGSEKGFACCVYIRVKDGKVYKSTLLFSKGKIVPKSPTRTTIPRLELMASALLSRALITVVTAIDIQVAKIYKMSDSTSALGMIHSQKIINPEFELFRTCEIKRAENFLTSKGYENFWIFCKSADNPADLPSRGTLDTSVLNTRDWKEGPSFWRELPFEKWPTLSVEEALQKISNENEMALFVDEDEKFEKADKKGQECSLDVLYKKNFSKEKFMRICCVVFRAVAKFKNNNEVFGNNFSKELFEFDTWKQRSVYKFSKVINDMKVIQRNTQCQKLVGRKVPIFSVTEFENVLNFWKKQASISKQQLKNFRNVKGFIEKDIAYISQRTDLEIGGDRVVILERSHPFAVSVLRWSHEILHTTDSVVVVESRKEFFISRAKLIVAQIRRNCNQCVKTRKEMLAPTMGNVHPLSIPSPTTRPFGSVFLDICGHFIIRDAVKKRVSMKVWILVLRSFCYPVIHLEIMDSMSLDSFLAAFARFSGRRGNPSFVFSDNGSQIRAFQQQAKVSTWNFDDKKIRDYATKESIEWEYSKKYAAFTNAIAEGAVHSAKSILKKVLLQTAITSGDFSTILTSVENIINSRPLFAAYENPTENFAGSVVTGNMILQFAADPKKVDLIDIERGGNTTNRVRRNREILEDFWKHWSSSEGAWNSMNKATKWQYDKTREPKVGDICQMKPTRGEKFKIGDYKLVRITDLIKSSRHSGTYAVNVEFYTGAKDLKLLENVSVRNLALLVPHN